MVANYNLLKGKIYAKGYKSIKRFANDMGLSEAGFIRKCNNPKNCFDIDESVKISNMLDINIKEHLEIFYGNKLEYKSR